MYMPIHAVNIILYTIIMKEPKVQMPSTQ